jgi:hypothetical protein
MIARAIPAGEEVRVQGTPPWYRPSHRAGVVVAGDDGRLLVTVRVPTLVTLLDPLGADPWGVGTVGVDEVQAALRERRLRPDNPCWQDTQQAVSSTRTHGERIAWLVHHGWDIDTELMHVDVDEYGGIGLNEGNHRLFALAFLGVAGPITVELSGYLDVAEVLFGVTIP